MLSAIYTIYSEHILKFLQEWVTAISWAISQEQNKATLAILQSIRLKGIDDLPHINALYQQEAYRKKPIPPLHF